jgi:mannose-1-phosphate guanylyltransferase
MKALILAAGHGTRMGQLTKKSPKCLLPVRGMPLLQIWLDLCAAHGITEVVVNAHAHSRAVHEFARNYRGEVSVSVFDEAHLLGSAGTLAANRARFECEPFFWIFYGDVLTSASLGRMLAFHLQRGQDATLGLYRVGNPRACGIVGLDTAGIVRDFQEKPQDPRSDLAFSGLMIGTPAIFEAIPPATPCDIGFHVLPRLVDRMAGYEISDYLVDIGTPDAYQLAQQRWPGFSSCGPTSEMTETRC